MLPESPFLYPEDEISTASVRFFVSELVRETALEQLDEEVPYSLACEVEEFRETQSPIYIRTVLYVERESQKRILIGAGGQRIRDIGSAARAKVEAFVGAPVYLDLWVKVLPNWRKSDQRHSPLRLPASRRPIPHDALSAVAAPSWSARSARARSSIAKASHRSSVRRAACAIRCATTSRSC